jgi:hypothetical protein
LLIHYLLRERHKYWETQKIKWEAKLAERQFREGSETDDGKVRVALRDGDPNLSRAAKTLEKLVSRITRSWRIVAVEIKITANEEETKKPIRRITFEDE